MFHVHLAAAPLSPKRLFCEVVVETKREDGAREHAGQGDHRANIQAHYPSTTKSGRFALLGCPPHAVTSSPTTHRPCPPAESPAVTPGLEWADCQHTAHDPNPAAPCPHLPAPAQVTGGRYTSQLPG